MRKTVVSLSTVFLFVVMCVAPPAHAVNKEMVQLQTQVQQLQDAVQHLQETQDQQLSVLQHVMQQMNDSVGKISATVTTLQTAGADAERVGRAARSSRFPDRCRGSTTRSTHCGRGSTN
jgi:conjugal transfer/entry exclusion protein